MYKKSLFFSSLPLSFLFGVLSDLNSAGMIFRRIPPPPLFISLSFSVPLSCSFPFVARFHARTTHRLYELLLVEIARPSENGRHLPLRQDVDVPPQRSRAVPTSANKGEKSITLIQRYREEKLRGGGGGWS